MMIIQFKNFWSRQYSIALAIVRYSKQCFTKFNRTSFIEYYCILKYNSKV